MAEDRKISVFGDQAGSVELLWGGRERPSRGPKPALSLDRITRTAIAIADLGGLAAVSMQRVAGELEFTKMSLYRYVPGKSELVALMIDTAMGEPPNLEVPSLEVPSLEAGAAGGEGGGQVGAETGADTGPAPGSGTGPDTGWRAALREWAVQLLAVFRRHPWLLSATMGPRVMGPNELGWTERALAALADTGLNGGERLDAVLIVSGHIRTLTQVSASMGVGSTRAQGAEEVMSAALNELLVGRSDRYPALAAAVASAETGTSRDQALQFGLERILDGLEVFIERRRAAAAGSA
ncbi:TetR/AcrR family transcriptional regulator C-terminal domain-containing protein [Streptomyces sp. MST-110588]|uniref:TetR/AcrR family transcriptional regulator n=1 Tax=Streptomyces sp. MST-110588 TaxID=2833628 RepID=UPI001F5D764F|nr:TetR/AcrR family transcriptional regulator C-terminal domain-containing protein [Streptomyces sp. MST-110588]UNO41949.1 TetR/AcrR family transcriptional regulator [Streptomyces sp. MST-110588]